MGALAALFLARPSAAQSRGCNSAVADAPAGPAVTWQPPLDRVVTAHANVIALRDALDRVSTMAKVRLSYSGELLPLDSAVCLSVKAVPIGRVLADLLAGTNVVATAIGGDQVVLAPHAPSAPGVASPEMASSMGVLDRVVVTGSVMGGPEREMTVGLDVLHGRQLSRENVSTLSGALDGYVPGVWSWAQSPSSLLSSYASIRGASSFGLSYPKIYIDGIEVANPLLVTRFSPDAIDRIEVIRGPQGSALYGTDAISGVINIVTRHEGRGIDAERASIRTTAGLIKSDFANSVLTQSHTATLTTGTSTRSADLNVSGGSSGEFIPNGYSRDLMATASARVVGARTVVSTTARFFMQDAGGASSPLITRPPPPTSTSGSPPPTAPDSQPQSMREYTVGTTATFTPNERWTHSATAGIDGYRLTNVQTNFTPIPSIALQDSALRAAQGTANRGTLRASSVVRLGNPSGNQATITMSGEQGVFRATSLSTQTAPPSTRSTLMPASSASKQQVTWQNSTGFTTQANASFDNTLFVTGGVRLERDSRLPGSKTAALPMLGTAVVRDYGPLTVKLRAAYGQGIRPPTTFGHTEFWQNSWTSATQPELGPERQSGTEAGLDVLLRRIWSLRVTRFDQRASGLIQQVALPADSNPATRRMRYELENVGEIANNGWELESSANVARLAVSGTLTFVHSRVEKVATGYRGDLVAGDRMLQVPASTGSVNLSWLGTRWFTSVGASRALDWINYDELGLATAYLSGTRSAHDLLGQQLRQYWRRYNGGLRVRATASRDVRNMFTFEVSGDNLLNYQRNEPDNMTVTPGRTLMTGVRLKF